MHFAGWQLFWNDCMVGVFCMIGYAIINKVTAKKDSAK